MSSSLSRFKNGLCIIVYNLGRCVRLNTPVFAGHFLRHPGSSGSRRHLSTSSSGIINFTESNGSNLKDISAFNPFCSFFNDREPTSSDGPLLKADFDLGSVYLENFYSVNPKEWIELFKNAVERETVLSLLTNFQRYIRHLRCRQLLFVAEKALGLGIRENRERIDVHHVLLAEILHRFLHRSNRILCVAEISRLCRVIQRLKFNKESEGTAIVPVCSQNFQFSKAISACAGCMDRYKQLLNLTGSDMVAVMTVVLGKSLLLQTRDMSRLHENAVVPYLVLVGSKNAIICSHLVRDIALSYRSQFLSSKSLHNIAILLHTIKRTKARVKPLEREIVRRLAGSDGIENLLAKERSTGTRLVAISQILQLAMNTQDSPSTFNRELDRVVFTAVKHVKEQFVPGNFDGLNQFPKLVSQLKLLAKVADLERHGLKTLLEEDGLSGFLSSLDKFEPTFEENDLRTSNIHVQVDAVLKSFNYDTRLEHYLPPYMVDIYIPASEAVVEVDGPYHYATGLNERVNKILRRDIQGFQLHYSLNSKLKRRLLLKSGFRVLNIPFYEWPPGLNEQAYLVSHLKL